MDSNKELAASNRLLDIIRGTAASDDKQKKKAVPSRIKTEAELGDDVSGLSLIRSEIIHGSPKPSSPKVVPHEGEAISDEVSREITDSSHKVSKLEPKPSLPPKRIVATETFSLCLGVKKKRNAMSTLFSKNMLGLDIGSHTIKSVQLEKNHLGFKLISLSVVEIATDTPDVPGYEQTKLLSIQRALKDIKLKQVKVVSAVGGGGVLIRQLRLPHMSAEELASSIKWESKKYIPYDIHEVKLDFQVINNEATSMDVLLVIVPKDMLNKYNSFLSRVQIKPFVTDVAPLALMNSAMAAATMADGEATVLLDIGAKTTTLNIYSEQAEYFVHYVPVSGNDLTQKIQQRFQLEYLEAEKLKKTGRDVVEVIKPTLDKIIYDIRRTLTFYKNQNSLKGFSRIILTGGNACIPQLDRYLADELNLRVEVLNPFQNIIVDEKVFPKETLDGLSCQLALAMGLAMRGWE